MEPPLLPVAAAVGAADVLFDLFVVLLAAKLGDELFRRLGQPVIVGEILAGVVVGPAALGLVGPSEVSRSSRSWASSSCSSGSGSRPASRRS